MTPDQQPDREFHKTALQIHPTATLATALPGGYALMTDSSSAKVTDGMLVGPSGMKLYVFDRDTFGRGKSVCNKICVIS